MRMENYLINHSILKKLRKRQSSKLLIIQQIWLNLKAIFRKINHMKFLMLLKNKFKAYLIFLLVKSNLKNYKLNLMRNKK